MTKMKNHRFNNIERHEQLMWRLADAREQILERNEGLELDSLEGAAEELGRVIRVLVSGGYDDHDCNTCASYDFCQLPQKKPKKKDFN